MSTPRSQQQPSLAGFPREDFQGFYHRDCASIDLPVVAIEREHVALVHDAITDP